MSTEKRTANNPNQQRGAGGRFASGNTLAKGNGRPVGSLGSLNKAMQERMQVWGDKGCYPDDLLMQIAFDNTAPLDLRFKAAKAACELVYPKQSASQIQIEEPKKMMSGEEMTARLKSILSNPQGGN